MLIESLQILNSWPSFLTSHVLVPLIALSRDRIEVWHGRSSIIYISVSSEMLGLRILFRVGYVRTSLLHNLKTQFLVRSCAGM